jgi:probable F420-dependent oxidoreductase
MQYGVILPNVGPLAHIDSLIQIASRAEGLGYDGVFLSDHIALPTELRSRYPYRSDGRFPLTAADRILEPVATLSYLAAITTRLQLGFSVLVLPYRHPVLNARMLGTLDVISNGRLIVGAGVGWLEEEFNALDTDFEVRGDVTDEHIEMLKAFWTDPAPTVRGNHYSVEGLGMAPPPVSRPHPPIWTGGISPPALRRAASLADGWHGVRQNPSDVARVAARIGELRSSRGASTEGFTISLRAGLDVADTPFDGAGRTPLRGSAEQVIGDLDEYARAGLDYLVVEPRAVNPEELIDQLERFADIERP